MRQGEYSVSWGISRDENEVSDDSRDIAEQSTSSQKSIEAEITELDLSKVNTEDKKTMALKASSSICYRDALSPGVDLEYVVLSSRVKESIILNNPKDISSYTL